MKDTKKTLILIEDDSVLSDSYRYYIGKFDNYVLKGAYGNIEDALKEYKKTLPDIVVSDISLPGMSGIEGIQKFKSIDSDVKVVMISVHDDLSVIRDSISNMSDGYLTKPVGQTNLLLALDALDDGGAALSSDVSRKLLDLLQEKGLAMFSERENEILGLLTKGHTYKSMADNLYITPSTINYHVQSIYLKLGVNSKSEALKVVARLKEEVF